MKFYNFWRSTMPDLSRKSIHRTQALGIILLLGLSLNSYATTAEDFDINRYSTAGAGWFKTFYVKQTEALRSALAHGRVSKDILVLVTETAAGKLALIRDQMAYHHIAEGTATGENWMVTF
jgi:hypothetical protein